MIVGAEGKGCFRTPCRRMPHDAGNGVDGLRLPDVQVPLGTYTDWNLRAAGYAEGEKFVGSGVYIPFAKTKTERLATGDPRLSLEERYPSHDYYVEKVTHAAKRLVHERFLLEEDAQAIIDKAIASTIGNP